MYELDKKIAQEIRSNDLSLETWFEEEINHLALSIAGLDEIPLAAMHTLAQLSAEGPQDARSVWLKTGSTAAEVENHLDALSEHGFAKASGNNHEATERGKDAFRAFGAKWIIRKRFELKSRSEHLDRLYHAVLAQPKL